MNKFIITSIVSIVSIVLFGSVCHFTDAEPTPIRLEQATPRNHDRLKFPQPYDIGPIIPGLQQGAVPQGFVFWEPQNWFLISYYFEKGRQPSLVAAIDARTGAMVRCLTLVETDGDGHTGHVGGLAVSDNYLWIGSEKLYRVPLANLVAAEPVALLQIEELFRAESTASYVAYADHYVWVGEFVLESDLKDKQNAPHHLQDRNDEDKYAWITGYALDANENITDGKHPTPVVILSVRQKVQGIAFLDGHIILSLSYGRNNDSTLAVYTNPLREQSNQPHQTVTIGDATVPVWFLDAQNQVREIIFPPMTEGITPYGKQLGIICESGAEMYQKGGRAPLDNIIFLDPLTVK